jgi:hypothetical protein
MTIQNAKKMLMLIAMVAIVSSGMVFHSTPAVAQLPANIDTKCIDGITQDIKIKSASFDEIRAKNIADNFGQLKAAVNTDQQKFNNISYTWNNDPSNCSVQLKDVLVQYTATDVNGNNRAIVVVLNPGYTAERVIIENDLPQHATGTAPNWGGYSVKGASTEASSLVYRATLNWLIPTPNDPAQLNCGTSGAAQCIISLWTGISKSEDGNQDMAQVGTDSYCTGNNCTSRTYHGWLETVPGGSLSACSTNTYASGDSMYGEVSNQKRSGGSVTKYDFYLIDTTQSQTCSVTNITFGSTDPHYAQFMSERPNFSGTLAHLPDFGTVSNLYGQLYYGGSTKTAYTAYSSGSTWYKQWTMYNGVNNESISAINSSNQFSVTWLTSQGT